MAKENTRKIIPVTIGLYADKQKQANVIRYEIEQLLKKDKPVPAKLLKEFLSFYKLSEPTVRHTSRTTEIVSLCIDKFGSKPNFEFEGEFKTDDETQHYSLSNLLNIVVFHIFLEIQYDKTKEVKDIIAPLAYSLVKKYRDIYLNEKHQNLLNDYKCRVLAAYITHLIVGKIAEKKNPNNWDLQDSIKHAIKKDKNKSPK